MAGRKCSNGCNKMGYQSLNGLTYCNQCYLKIPRETYPKSIKFTKRKTIERLQKEKVKKAIDASVYFQVG